MNWKPIPGISYEASDAGEIRNATTKRIVKPYTDSSQEYKRITIYDDRGFKRKIMVHYLVASAYIGPKPEGMEIDHINTDISDNRPANLRYVTPQQNAANPFTKFNRLTSKIHKRIIAGTISEDEVERVVRVIKAVL